MILALDVGNTNIVVGVFQGARLEACWRLSTTQPRTADELGILLHQLFGHLQLDPSRVGVAVVASVVPPLTSTVEDMLEKYFHIRPLVVGPGIRTGIDIRYDHPREVGADRIVNAVAAFEHYGGPCIVVDFGTATTFDAIAADGAYLGGAIAPGIGISTEALFQKAAKLPRVELVRPLKAIGKSTVASMQAGIVIGFAGQVDELVRRIAAELGGRPTVIATGGLASLIAGETTTIDHVDDLLTLKGLLILHERNKDAGAGSEPAPTGN